MVKKNNCKLLNNCRVISAYYNTVKNLEIVKNCKLYELLGKMNSEVTDHFPLVNNRISLVCINVQREAHKGTKMENIKKKVG